MTSIFGIFGEFHLMDAMMWQICECMIGDVWLTDSYECDTGNSVLVLKACPEDMGAIIRRIGHPRWYIHDCMRFSVCLPVCLSVCKRVSMHIYLCMNACMLRYFAVLENNLPVCPCSNSLLVQSCGEHGPSTSRSCRGSQERRYFCFLHY